MVAWKIVYLIFVIFCLSSNNVEFYVIYQISSNLCIVLENTYITIGVYLRKTYLYNLSNEMKY